MGPLTPGGFLQRRIRGGGDGREALMADQRRRAEGRPPRGLRRGVRLLEKLLDETSVRGRAGAFGGRFTLAAPPQLAQLLRRVGDLGPESREGLVERLRALLHEVELTELVRHAGECRADRRHKALLLVTHDSDDRHTHRHDPLEEALQPLGGSLQVSLSKERHARERVTHDVEDR